MPLAKNHAKAKVSSALTAVTKFPAHMRPFSRRQITVETIAISEAGNVVTQRGLSD